MQKTPPVEKQNSRPEPELRHITTPDGKYVVPYIHMKAPWDYQNSVFDAHGLTRISPAQKAFMSTFAPRGSVFLKYSRTNMGVLFMETECGQDIKKETILIKDSCAYDNAILDLLYAHHNVIEKPISKDLAYALIEIAQKNNSVFRMERDIITLSTKELGNSEEANFMFTDRKIGADAQKYGERLYNLGISKIELDLEDKTAEKLGSGIYYNQVRMLGLKHDCRIVGRGKPLTGEGESTGLRFERANTYYYKLQP